MAAVAWDKEFLNKIMWRDVWSVSVFQKTHVGHLEGLNAAKLRHAHEIPGKSRGDRGHFAELEKGEKTISKRI